jgi:hypothetical protein
MRQTLMRRISVVATLSLLGLPLWADNGVPTHTQNWEFVGGGTVNVHFRAGDLKVLRGTDALHINLRYKAEQDHKDASDRVRMRFEAQGPDAIITVKAPNHISLDAVLEVPSPVTLEVRMLAGDLTVECVEGSKSLLTHFGDITVVEPKDAYPRLYRFIDASTRIGDVGGLKFNHEHGWLGHSGEFSGQGSYDLRAHVGTGDISFQSQ